VEKVAIEQVAEFFKKFKLPEKNLIEMKTYLKNSNYATIELLLDLATNAYELFKSSKLHQKRRLLQIVFSNFILRDGSLCFSLKKPFDMMVNLDEHPEWSQVMDGFGTVYKLDILSFYPYRNEITELLKSIKNNNQLVNGDTQGDFL